MKFCWRTNSQRSDRNIHRYYVFLLRWWLIPVVSSSSCFSLRGMISSSSSSSSSPLSSLVPCGLSSSCIYTRLLLLLSPLAHILFMYSVRQIKACGRVFSCHWWCICVVHIKEVDAECLSCVAGQRSGELSFIMWNHLFQITHQLVCCSDSEVRISKSAAIMDESCDHRHPAAPRTGRSHIQTEHNTQKPVQSESLWWFWVSAVVQRLCGSICYLDLCGCFQSDLVIFLSPNKINRCLLTAELLCRSLQFMLVLMTHYNTNSLQLFLCCRSMCCRPSWGLAVTLHLLIKVRLPRVGGDDLTPFCLCFIWLSFGETSPISHLSCRRRVWPQISAVLMMTQGKQFVPFASSDLHRELTCSSERVQRLLLSSPLSLTAKCQTAATTFLWPAQSLICIWVAEEK